MEVSVANSVLFKKTIRLGQVAGLLEQDQC